MVNSDVFDLGFVDESVNGAEAESAFGVDAAEGVPSGGNASIFQEVEFVLRRALAMAENEKHDEHRLGYGQLFKVS